MPRVCLIIMNDMIAALAFGWGQFGYGISKEV